MTSLNPATIWFIVAVFVIGGIFDVWLLVKNGANATISHTFYALSQRYPIIAFALGVLCGHLLWINA